MTSEKALQGWPIDAAVVLKLDGSWGGDGVVIAHSRAEAVKAFRRIKGPVEVGRALKRSLIDRLPSQLSLWRRGAGEGLTVQEFIQGRSATSMFAAWEGEILAIVTVEVLASQGITGSAVVVQLIKNEEIERAARLIAKTFMLSGFHGLDFIIQERTDTAFLIEMNARATQLGHLRIPSQGDLAGCLIAGHRSDLAHEVTGCIQETRIALFPQALKWAPEWIEQQSVFHDVPLEEPALRLELLRDSWPMRRWPSRLYHFFRVEKHPSGVKSS
jgi:hypothetical protein